MRTGQLNVSIDTNLINKAKSQAYANGLKLYQFVELALREYIESFSDSKVRGEK